MLLSTELQDFIMTLSKYTIIILSLRKNSILFTNNQIAEKPANMYFTVFNFMKERAQIDSMWASQRFGFHASLSTKG